MIDVKISAHDNIGCIASQGVANGETLPFVISLRLLDSKDTPIASELAPFAQSYDVS